MLVYVHSVIHTHGGNIWSHTRLTPKTAKIYKPLALGRFSPLQVPTPQLPGALPCLLKVNFRWLFPSHLFFICTEMVKISPARKEGGNEGYPAFRPERVTQCMGETGTLSKAQDPSRDWEPGPQKTARPRRSSRILSCLVLIACSPFHPSVSQPPQTWEARYFPGRAFFQVLSALPPPRSPRSAP